MSIFHFVNGSFISDKESFISPFDLGLLRGYGVFDYVQLYKGRPFHLLDHLERLKWASEQMELPFPMSLSALSDLTYELIEKNPPINGGIRFILTGGKSNDFLLQAQDSNLMILLHPLSSNPEWFYNKGMKALSTHMLRLMPSVKTTNYFPAILAMKKAKRNGFDDALFINENEEILEGTTCNVFFFKEGKIITSNSDDIVKGITRNIILDLAAKNNYSIEYRSLPINEIESCNEAFLCSSVKDLIPLVQINERKVGNGLPGIYTTQLRKIYHTYIESYFSQIGALVH